MFYSVLALLLRSLRLDVRSRGAHLARMGLCVTLYFAIVQHHITAALMGAPGLEFFRSILWLNLTFLTLFGISVFPSSIAEEKEEDSLGLLRMAGVDPLGLLLGKVGGRLMQALALLVVQFPFTLLAITLGGITIDQIWSTYVALTAFLLMLAGLGVLCSTICHTTRSASGLMVTLLIGHFLVSLLCQLQIFELKRTGVTSDLEPLMQFVSDTCIYLKVASILSTGYAEALITVQVITNVISGILSFLLSWALFEVCTRNPRSEPMTRGLVTHRKTGFRFFNPGRAFSNPLIWKDFHFATGGIAGLLLRTLFYVAAFAVMSVFFAPGNLQIACTSFLIFQLIFLPLDASLLVSQAMQAEARGQTIPALIMLPRSVPSIVYSKLAGALIGLFPGLACFAVAFAFSGLLEKWLEAGAFAEMPLTILVALMYMALLPHLTAVIALVVRWGATPLALAALYAVQMAEGMVLVPIFILMPAAGGVSIYIYFSTTILMNLALCVACHFEMLRRFRKLAEK